MTSVLATNITSPLGMSSGQNYEAVRKGISALSRQDCLRGLPFGVTVSCFSEGQTASMMVEGFTRFESLVIHSVGEALSGTDIDVKSPRTVFILSTTKGNVGELSSREEGDGLYFPPGESAARIAAYFGFSTRPVVICNACISGATAWITADRLISSGHYDNAVICGADCLSTFTLAGFQSFKSLSPSECRPFDIERMGLNLGEAAATVILGKADGGKGKWTLVSGYLDNDAYHISAPSPDGEGVGRAISKTLEGHDVAELAEVCVHGTATMFNDQMESKAIERSGLSSVPAVALKGYFGHTLGASGILETVVTMKALDDGMILPTRGFSETGVSGAVSISGTASETSKESFLKIVSGFGGCNAAMLFSKGDVPAPSCSQERKLKILHTVRISPCHASIDGEDLPVTEKGKELLTELYKTRLNDCPKFYKMDIFSRLVFVAAELLAVREKDGMPAGERGIIIFNSSSSVVADRQHLSTISDREDFFPSPSVFVYTLPNIVTGEIAIKHGYRGETSLIILDRRDDEMMSRIIGAAFLQQGTGSLLTGWADCPDENTFEAELSIVTY